MSNFPRLTRLVESKEFSYFIITIILINAFFVGVELTHFTPTVYYLQKTCLVIFIIEIFMRWFGRRTTSDYVSDWWNWFDIAIVLISLLPQGNPHDVGIYSAFRIVRVFRVLRLFKVFPSMGKMSLVLFRSMKALSQAIFLLFIFMYLYALFGVILFKNKVALFTMGGGKIDPFGNVGEALFSLFRVTTGEDWTDLRYDLMDTGVSHTIINIYFVTWMILSAFLLLNIIIGAIVNNYEYEFNKEKDEYMENKINRILKILEEKETK